MKSKILGFLLITFSVFGILCNIYINTDKVLADVPSKLIRLHVVANSDSPEDQELKRKVRDEVIDRVSPRFESLKSIEEVKQLIADSLSEIESIAQEVIVKNGKSYSVKAELGDFDFPTKQYGSLTLPAGTYQALNIKIGNAEGNNWWCVMFPPLCFIDIAHGVVPQETMSRLRESLTDEEYELLLSAETEQEIPVKLKFKILEIAKSLNLKIVEFGEALKNSFGLK
ncbi:MAG: stage II sporulation protein R [Bacillota bacterium]